MNPKIWNSPGHKINLSVVTFCLQVWLDQNRSNLPGWLCLWGDQCCCKCNDRCNLSSLKIFSFSLWNCELWHSINTNVIIKINKWCGSLRVAHTTLGVVWSGPRDWISNTSLGKFTPVAVKLGGLSNAMCYRLLSKHSRGDEWYWFCRYLEFCLVWT